MLHHRNMFVALNVTNYLVKINELQASGINMYNIVLLLTHSFSIKSFNSQQHRTPHYTAPAVPCLQ
jgi:hypothetical protein